MKYCRHHLPHHLPGYRARVREERDDEGGVFARRALKRGAITKFRRSSAFPRLRGSFRPLNSSGLHPRARRKTYRLAENGDPFNNPGNPWHSALEGAIYKR